MDDEPVRKNLNNVWWFLTIVVICTIAAWIVMSKANDRLEATHNTIITHQQNSINSIDSLLKIYWKSQTDSLRKPSDTLTEQLNSQLIKIAQSAAENNNERITNLLESELSKIQNEYEVLNLWCALLTVVFLIFSFFSIFKANEMANQSENALNSMRGIAHTVQKKSEEVDNDIQKAKVKIDEVSNSIGQLSNKQESLSNAIKSTKDNDLGSVKNKITELSEKIDSLNKDIGGITDILNSEYNKKKEELYIHVESIKSNLHSNISDIANNILTKLIEESNSRIDSLEIKFSEIQEILKEINNGREGSLYTEVTEEGAEDRSLTDPEEGIFDSDEERPDYD